MTEEKIETPTWEEVKALVFGLGKRAAELDEKERKRDEEYKKRKEESDEEYKKRKEESDEEYKKWKRESDEQHKRNLEAIDDRFKRERKESEERLDRDIKKSNKEANKKLNKLETLFTGQWGKLVECLVQGRLVSLFNERGIEVMETSERISGYCKELDKQYEYDIIAHNGNTVVIVEVKTTLHIEDVKDFLEKMKEIHITLKRYQNSNIEFVGAVAYLSTNSAAHVFAEKQGLFVIKAVGDSAKIINKKDFLPKVF